MKKKRRQDEISEELIQRADLEDLLLDIYRTLLRFWKSRGLTDQAEDLAQEGVLKCLQMTGKWKGKNGASIKTFLVKVGKNRGIDYLRKEARQEKIKERKRTSE